MRSSVRQVVALSLALAGAGCAAPPDEPVTAGLEGSVGVLDVERVAGSSADDRTELTAAFARYRGLDAGSVLGLLGSRSPADLESCAFVGADDAMLAVDDYAVVELLDVGTIRVRVPGTSEASLAPRAFPDLASVVAGVFYAGDATLATTDADEYAFTADGSAEVPAFEAIVPAPAQPADLRVDGASVDGALVATREGGLDLSWAAADPRDVVEIEVRAGGDVLACASHDDGAFRIDAESLATLAPDTAATLVVRRVRVTPVDVPGLDDAFARVAITRQSPIDLR